MITVDVCMETFERVPYLERPALIAGAGFSTLEVWFPHLMIENDPGPVLRKACDAAGVRVNNLVVNSPAGDIGGSLTDPEDRPAYLERVREAMRCCGELGAPMAITCTGNLQPGIDRGVQRQSIVDGLVAAGDIAGEAGVTLVVEPLNTQVDHAGYFLDQPEAGAEIVREVDHPHVGLLFDVYHMQVMRGNVIETIRACRDVIRHFHSAGVPGRHELDTGELDYPRILAAVAEMGYQGCFGLEYFPRDEAKASLARMRALLSDRK